jgi:CRP-like cAMP-binding protein
VKRLSDEKKYALVDRETGAVVEEYAEKPASKQIHIHAPDDTTVIFGSRKKKDRRDFVRVYTEHLEWLAININHLTTRKVLDILLANLDWDGAVRLTQTEIGKKLGIKQQQVARAIKELEKLNVIRCEKAGRGNVYYINDSLAWKGDLESKEKRSKFKVIEGGLTQ